MKNTHSHKIVLYENDIPERYAEQIHQKKVVAWDIETSGLDWKSDVIATCQLYIPGNAVAIIKMGNTPPNILQSLLADISIKKVFHFAIFDLRFMSFYWKVKPQNIACTKIASKLLDPDNRDDHSLEAILKKYLDVEIDKSQQQSDWLSKKLTEEQINYAANDVIYLLLLLDVLERELKSKGLFELAQKCFAHIPTRAHLDILGYEDIYVHW